MRGMVDAADKAGTESTNKATSQSSKLVVEVVVGKAPHLGTFSYYAGRRQLEDLVGRAVLVPFGKGEDWGVVLGEGDETQATKKLVTTGPVLLTPEEVEVCRWAARRWVGELARVALAATPKEVLRELGPKGRQAGRLPNAVDDESSEERRVVRRYVAVPPKAGLAEQAAQGARRSMGRILILAPSVASQEAVAAELERLGEESYVVWHGSDAAAYADGLDPEGARIIVAGRHHALWPVEGLRQIIVVDDHHPGHRQPTQPYLHSRDIAIGRSRITGVDVRILGRVPGPEALWGGVRFEEAGSKTAQWPRIEVEAQDPSNRGLSSLITGRVKTAQQAGEKVAVVHAGGRAGWFCRRCGAKWMCGRCQTHVKVGGCECPGRPDAARCDRCRSIERVIVGWDATRIRRELGSRVIDPEAVDVLTVPELYARGQGAGEVGEYGLVVVLESDSYAGWASDPGLEAARVIITAAGLVADGGRLLCHGARRGGVARALMRERSTKGIAQRGWETARKEGLVPFIREVHISITGPRPDTRTLPGRVHGPSKGADGWQILVRCDDEELAAVGEWAAEMRSGWRRKLRVEAR